MNFSLYYRKNKNDELFKTLENSDINITNGQNYIPLYNKFFSLNNSNYNNINLNHKFYLDSINKAISKNVMDVMLSDASNNLYHKTIFCKFSPLLDPLRYMTGKYDISNENIFSLPRYEDNVCLPKLLDVNNTSYIDGFFTYLSSQLMHHYGFIHGLDYYGCFLGNQREFKYNIIDDIDYLNDSDFFHEKKGKLFSVDNNEYNEIFNIDSRKNKKKIVINNTIDNLVTVDNLNDLNFSIFDNNNTNDDPVIIDLSNVCIYNTILKGTSKDSDSESSCSSKSSNTSVDDHEINSDSGSEANSDTISIDSDEEEEEDIFCSISNFPIEMICLEKCENTLDMLMEEELLNQDEWVSCLFQIIMILTLYQQTFNFTHNDLHTNNIMYVTTEKQHIYYCYNSIYYKVPTYGKIYKIIDFGRAIYKFNGNIMCSDSFHAKGDAASQYNCEPYFDKNKPRLEPNKSFDLCRLACCLFDNFVDDVSDTKKLVKKNKIVSLLYDWLLDDKERNILYKNNGDERYPEFKLYKMIARTVHNAIPCDQISKDIFSKYKTVRKKINKNNKILNLDNIPSMQM